MSLREKINQRMDRLQEMMESNHHMSNPQEVIDLISRITPFWNILCEEDRDYIHGSQYAIEEKHVWDLTNEV